MKYLFTRKAFFGRIVEAGEVIDLPGDTIPNEAMIAQPDVVEAPVVVPQFLSEPEPVPEPEPQPEPEPAPEMEHQSE